MTTRFRQVVKDKTLLTVPTSFKERKFQVSEFAGSADAKFMIVGNI
jgi:hypothetical protein